MATMMAWKQEGQDVMMDIVERLRKNCTCNFESSPCGAEEECQNTFDGADEIVKLRLANSDLQMWFDYARAECDKLQTEVLKLREELHELRLSYEIVVDALKEKE